MGEPQVSHAASLKINIDGGPDLGPWFTEFNWKSFINEGYIIRCKLVDPHWGELARLATDKYLAKARKEPTKIEWELGWDDSHTTGKHLGYLTNLEGNGINLGGEFEFVAVDPPSFWLNGGDASGKCYEGSVKQVIEKILNEYFIGPNGSGKMEVSDTNDNKVNSWWMMRQDPKTFISSILEWSASVTQKKTNWIVSSSAVDGNPQIWVKEQADRKIVNFGVYILDARQPAANDIINFSFLSDNIVSLLQKQLITQGISAISGKYLDRITDNEREQVHVYDEVTSAKIKTMIDQTKGFAKPEGIPGAVGIPHEWSTAIMAIPEHNGGDIGLQYSKYIDGRARGKFMNMLRFVMRVKIRVFGEISRELANSHNLGVSKLKIVWVDPGGKMYFIDGEWLVYGFHHVATRSGWHTDLYCYRLDYDAIGTNA
jgi:hypothetical protein